MQQIFFSLSEMKTQKNNTNEHAGVRRKFEEKVREKGWAVLIFTVVFAFLF